MGSASQGDVAESRPQSSSAAPDIGVDPTLTLGASPAEATIDTTLDTATPEAPGRYERGEELGRGGMGRVVLARDHHLGRSVAIKELLDERSPEGARRFPREARVMAALEHPGIVPVHEVGRRADGSLYYTMRRVRGRSFSEVLSYNPDDRERRRLLDTFIGACQAMAHAHAHGAVHRDLKPGNLMIGERGEALVLDWGLAAQRGEGPGSATTSGSASGDLTMAESEDGPALRDLSTGELLARAPVHPVHFVLERGPVWLATARRNAGDNHLATFDASGRIVVEREGLAGGNDAITIAIGGDWVAGGGPLVRGYTLPALSPGLALRHGGRRAAGADFKAGKLAVVTDEGRLGVWNARTSVMPDNVGAIEGVAAMAREWGEEALTLSGSGVRLWYQQPPALSLATPTPGRPDPHVPMEPANVFFLQDGAILSSNRQDLLWMGGMGSIEGRAEGLGEIFSVAEGEIGGKRLLAVGGGHQEVALLERPARPGFAGGTVRWISGHLGTDIIDVSFVPEGIRSVHAHGDVKVLSLEDGHVLSTTSLGGPCRDAATSPDGALLAVSEDRPPTLALYDAAFKRIASTPTSDGVTDLAGVPTGASTPPPSTASCRSTRSPTSRSSPAYPWNAGRSGPSPSPGTGCTRAERPDVCTGCRSPG